MKKSFNIPELLHRKSKQTSWNPKAHAPPSPRPELSKRHQEQHDLKHSSSVDLIITKQKIN
jgi:hypothetical protein